jgi:uncharacterized Zn finger protein (UPF0148 family)
MSSIPKSIMGAIYCPFCKHAWGEDLSREDAKEVNVAAILTSISPSLTDVQVGIVKYANDDIICPNCNAVLITEYTIGGYKQCKH